ncbi:FAD-binding oxidoreductase [Dactylosporangium vinaceum]|uniref:FAD-dependent oxidoreductase n=1 Tax=Dactylosporangium vinaceum TaxID=53362 RepID=A0ABV5M3V8_9ACTN|nr:FAD-dependent oxidoreductase [Dactylosporangium vinaceum]UAB93538.1 FAD-binding oxidoreductase [Dactylosporangium vinaceum]
MRIGIIGAGLAGSLLAWRLARAGADVELATGPPGLRDATSVSGGAVRGYDPDPRQRELARDSLAELRDSPVLRRWAAFVPLPSVLFGAAGAGALAGLDARVVGVPELTALGWAALEPGTSAVLDTGGGRTDPAALRAAVLADLAARANATVTTRLPGEPDVLVYAAGAWTPALLARAGLDALGLRVKAIRYTVHHCQGPLPPIFSDGALYGIPLGGDLLLAGVATEEWAVAPGDPPARPAVDVARLLRRRLPGLRPGPPVRRVDATDCYADPPVLCLREVPGTGGRVLAFTGGSGGAAKTALAASARAAEQILGTTPDSPHHNQEDTRVQQ